MSLSDYAFDLPDDLIAQYPATERSAARLLVLDGHGVYRDARISAVAELVNEHDVLVFNDTRVFNARVFARKKTGGRVEILVERVLDARHILAHTRASKPLREGATLTFAGGEHAVVQRFEGTLCVMEFDAGLDVHELLAQHGQVPLPPYIRRQPEGLDASRYQTVYARERGAVAAPTAGLHFDDALLRAVAARGARCEFLTLHVGAGTFAPMREEDVDRHEMHKEQVFVSAALCDAVAQARRHSARVIAVGTTCVRALETAARDGQLKPFTGETQLFIRPGFDFHCVDALLTNFHLPRSTLLMLVCAFAGHDAVLGAYRHAVDQRYRFYSYGDAMWLTRAGAL